MFRENGGEAEAMSGIEATGDEAVTLAGDKVGSLIRS